MCELCGVLSVSEDGGQRVLLGSGSFDRIHLYGKGAATFRAMIPSAEDFFGEAAPGDPAFDENFRFLEDLAAQAGAGGIPAEHEALALFVAWAVGSALAAEWTLLSAPLSPSEIGSTYDDYRRAMLAVVRHPEIFAPRPAHSLDGDD